MGGCLVTSKAEDKLRGIVKGEIPVIEQEESGIFQKVRKMNYSVYHCNPRKSQNTDPSERFQAKDTIIWLSQKFRLRTLARGPCGLNSSVDTAGNPPLWLAT